MKIPTRNPTPRLEALEARNGSFTLNLQGGACNDTVTIDSSGRVEGNLTLTGNGSTGNDTARATVALQPGGQGTFGGQVQGGVGSDVLVFNVDDQSGGMRGFLAELDRGFGFDTYQSTPNVRIVPKPILIPILGW